MKEKRCLTAINGHFLMHELYHMLCKVQLLNKFDLLNHFKGLKTALNGLKAITQLADASGLSLATFDTNIMP